MARKNVLLHYPMLNAASMVTSQTSPVTDIAFLDNAGILVSWSGTSPVGAVTVECANPSPDAREDAYEWHELSFGSAIAVSGNTGSHVLTLNQLPFTKIRINYNATSGSGTITALLSVKQVGG